MITLRKSAFIFTLVFVLGVSACERSGTGTGEPDVRLKIVTTIAPLYCFTKNIAGDTVALENLLPSGVGPHEYSLSPEDAGKIADADIVIKNGVGLEEWMEKLITSADEIRSGPGKLVVVETGEGVKVINNDPHIWLSPRNVIMQVRNIETALITALPENADLYRKNAADYIRRLEGLDGEIRAAASEWKRRELITFHSAFAYFANEYGLIHYAVLEGSPEANPSPAHIADIVDKIKRSGVTVIFSEPDASHRIMGSISNDMGLKIYSLDTLETGDLGPDWYISRMKANLETLNRALGTKWTR